MFHKFDKYFPSVSLNLTTTSFFLIVGNFSSEKEGVRLMNPHIQTMQVKYKIVYIQIQNTLNKYKKTKYANTNHAGQIQNTNKQIQTIQVKYKTQIYKYKPYRLNRKTQILNYKPYR